jgi:hypothetical protein
MFKNTAKETPNPHPSTCFLCVVQKLYFNKKLDEVLGQYLDFIQIPHHEKVTKRLVSLKANTL